MQTIDPLFFTQGALATKSQTPSQELGKYEFLNLLMTQLRNQDPLNVQDDREFIAQMAQFSSLEQTTNLSLAIENMSRFQQLSQGSELIGKTVEAHLTGVDGNPSSETFSGLVTETRLVDGNVVLMVDDQAIDLKNVIRVSATSDSNFRF